MGVCFNRQIYVLATTNKLKHNKNKQPCQTRLSQGLNVRPKARHQLSTKDIFFLHSIGLKVRKSKK